MQRKFQMQENSKCNKILNSTKYDLQQISKWNKVLNKRKFQILKSSKCCKVLTDKVLTRKVSNTYLVVPNNKDNARF